MGRNKSGLEDSNLYQRRVVAWRVAEMLMGDALGRPRPDVIRVEVDEAGDWDDLQEQTGARIDRWQVKRQQEALPAETLKGLVEALREQPGVWGHLLFMCDVEFYAMAAAPKGRRPRRLTLGSVCDLRAMSDRWRGQQVDIAAATGALTAAERPLFDAVAGWLGGRSSALETLSRLIVERCRSNEDLEREGRTACARIFDDADRAWTLIKARVEDVRHGEQELRPADLWRHLGACALQPGLRAPQHVRDAYLRSVSERARADHPLSGLAGAALDLPLWELWVERSVTWDQPAPPTYDASARRAEVGASTPLSPEGAPTNPTPPRTETLRDDLGRLLAAPPRKLLAVLGEAGSGKSQLLRRCWADLADRALQDLDAPVPFLLRVQDLSRPSIADVILTLVGHESALVHRQRDPRIYLVDGLDEVPLHDQERVRDRLRDLTDDPRTVAVAVTCRPSHRVEVPPVALVLWLEPWSASDAELLVARWERHDAEAVRRLRETPHTASLATSPLILSLALWVAHDEPAALRSRSRVFARVVEKLALGWPEGRGALPIEIAERWEELQPPLSALAWEMISGGVAELDRTSVESHLRRVRPARLTLWLDWADRQLGLLMRTGTGGYAFLLRPLAEYLAGLCLATRDDAEILAASDQIWGAEVVRHALGHLADQGDYARVQRLIAALVEGWEQDFQTALGLRILVRPVHLRRVLVAARACADVGVAVAPLAEELGEVFWSYLNEETSVWVGDRIAAAVEEIAAAGGVVWEVLRGDLVAVLSKPTERPTVPNTGDLTIAPKEALWMTLHRDPQVRAALAVHLAPLAHSQGSWPLLVTLLADTDHTFWVEPLGLQLARQLRAVDRSLMPAEAREMLVRWLQAKRSLGAQLAAMVFRPGEAPSAQLAAGLMRTATSYHSALDLVQELGATSEGAFALDTIWSDWRERVAGHSQRDTTPHGPESVPLISQTVLRRLCQCLGRERARDPETLRLLTRLTQGGSDETARALCGWALHDPAVIQPLLAGRRIDERDQTLRRTYGTWGRLTLETQALLRLAADRHPVLRADLHALWARLQGEHDLISWFPGVALEGMVMTGDTASAEIYAEWIGATHRHRVPPELHATPAVVAALRADVQRTWQWATVPDERGMVGAPSMAGEGLAGLWSFWSSTDIFEGLLGWLEARDLEQVYGALIALAAVPAGDSKFEQVREHFLRGFQRLLGGTGYNVDLRRVQAILALRTSALLVPLMETLAPLLDAERADVALAAASVLVPYLDNEAAQPIVEAIVKEWPQGAWLPQLEEAMTPLVLACPAAFSRRILDLATDDPQQALRLTASIQHLLPTDHRETVLARVHPAARTPFPWQPISDRQLKRARPLDLLDQLTFDLGLPLLDE